MSQAVLSDWKRCSEDDTAFLTEVRAFLGQALTSDLREAGRDTVGVHSELPACRAWHQRLFERGWIAPAWPVAYGGTGWTARQRMLFEHECAENDAPILFAGGIRTLGPLLIAIGTAAQRQRYLPAILDGRDLWCQGFSETGAGSDLAALQTRAACQGDHYMVSGAKIWTTGAHIATRMFCLVRTRHSPRPQDGITFLLIDMETPGIKVRPVISIAGEHEFNEVVFTDVRVPVENRVGEENEGWSAAKLLMKFARSNNTTSGLLRRVLRRLREFECLDSSNESRRRISELECKLRAFEGLELRILAQTSEITAVQSSMLKTLATELHQKIAAALFDVTAFAAGEPARRSASASDLPFAIRKYLATRAASIYSGTNETHRNLMARSLCN